MANKERQIQLIQLVKEAIARDKELRDKYQVGEKFKFVPERLQKLLEQLEKNLHEIETHEKEMASSGGLAAEAFVYVYLFNAHGLDIKSWIRMLTPTRFYEYSVNRPIYTEQKSVETFIRNKKSVQQHAYLKVGVNKADILQAEIGKDALGYPLARLKEGALHFENLVEFVHNGNVYQVNEEGEITKKVQ